MKRFLAVDSSVPSYKSSSESTVSVNSPFISLLFLQRLLLMVFLLILSLTIYAQQDDDFKKVLTERSSKIVTPLAISDKTKNDRVVNELVNQYTQVNAIHAKNKTVTDEIKKQSLNDSDKSTALKNQEAKKSAELLQQHERFIAQLKKDLSDEQIEKVKDGMTYGVFPKTYNAFLEMIPTLTPAQKEKIYNWLKEARELAMDEGTSDDKHKVFGKYKGRINNYLSSEGYDLKKEQLAWQERIKKKEGK